MFGFHFPLNFNYPYISRSITEFWRRWHISLGTWFREYVYIPLGGNRRGLKLQLRNILIVWALTGIWHGASWNFLLWGLYFGLLLMMEKLFLLRRLEKCPAVVSWFYTMTLVVIGWVIFASTDGAGGPEYLAAMLGQGARAFDETALYLIANYGVLLILCAVGSTPLAAKTAGAIRSRIGGAHGRGTAWQMLWSVAAAAVFVLCTAYLVDASYNPFLYFRF